jgi:uncharacterized protein
MTSLGQLVRHYIELALIETGAAHIVRQPDVRAELDAIAAALDDIEAKLAILAKQKG